MERYKSFAEVKYRPNGEPIPDGYRTIIFKRYPYGHAKPGPYKETFLFSDYRQFSFRGKFMVVWAEDLGAPVMSHSLNNILFMETYINSEYYLMALEKYAADHNLPPCGDPDCMVDHSKDAPLGIPRED